LLSEERGPRDLRLRLCMVALLGRMSIAICSPAYMAREVESDPKFPAADATRRGLGLLRARVHASTSEVQRAAPAFKIMDYTSMEY